MVRIVISLRTRYCVICELNTRVTTDLTANLTRGFCFCLPAMLSPSRVSPYHTHHSENPVLPAERKISHAKKAEWRRAHKTFSKPTRAHAYLLTHPTRKSLKRRYRQSAFF